MAIYSRSSEYCDKNMTNNYPVEQKIDCKAEKNHECFQTRTAWLQASSFRNDDCLLVFAATVYHTFFVFPGKLGNRKF